MTLLLSLAAGLTGALIMFAGDMTLRRLVKSDLGDLLHDGDRG